MFRTIAATIAFTVCAHAQTSPPPPTCDAPEHRAFDFWIGEWDAYTTGTENLVGRSSIKSENAGCVITEHWTSVGAQTYSGQSLNSYDREARQWNQYWMDSTGEVTRFAGGPHERGMRLTDPANVNTGINSGGPFQTRMTFTPNPDGSVRQHGETSGDGVTWTSRYDLTYRRRTN